MIGVNPYIAFKGNCQEAIDFYKDALGAEVIFASLTVIRRWPKWDRRMRSCMPLSKSANPPS